MVGKNCVMLTVQILFFQLRRQARLRREYLYRKGLEEKQKAILERKKKLQKAIEGKYSKYIDYSNKKN